MCGSRGFRRKREKILPKIEKWGRMRKIEERKRETRLMKSWKQCVLRCAFAPSLSSSIYLFIYLFRFLLNKWIKKKWDFFFGEVKKKWDVCIWYGGNLRVRSHTLAGFNGIETRARGHFRIRSVRPNRFISFTQFIVCIVGFLDLWSHKYLRFLGVNFVVIKKKV